MCAAHWNTYRKNYLPRSANVLVYPQEPATWHLTCSVQSQAVECLNCTHTLLLFFPVMLLIAKGIYLNQDCSGFEIESSVLFRIWTWKFGKPSQAFRTLPLLSFFSFVGQTQAKIKNIICIFFCCSVCFCHLFTSNNLVNFKNKITAIF